MKVTLPAETVLNAVLQSVKAIGECDGELLAELACHFYPIPEEFKNEVEIKGEFNPDTDEISLTFSEAPSEENWDEIGEDEELDEPKK